MASVRNAHKINFRYIRTEIVSKRGKNTFRKTLNYMDEHRKKELRKIVENLNVDSPIYFSELGLRNSRIFYAKTLKCAIE